MLSPRLPMTPQAGSWILSGSCPSSRAVATACVSCPGFHSASLTVVLRSIRPMSAIESSSSMAQYGIPMACRITELVLDCRNPEVLADFWCRVLGFVVLKREQDGSIEIGPAGTDPDDPGLTLVFGPTSEPKQTKLRLHFDVNAVDRDQDAELQRLLELGARK